MERDEPGVDDAGVEAGAAAAVESALHPQDAAADAQVRDEMDGLFRRDRLMSLVFVVALVVILPFTIVAMWGVVPSDGARAVMIGAACVLATYNIASMITLVRGYQRDKDFIYRRDVAHLRELKAARRAGGTEA